MNAPGSLSVAARSAQARTCAILQRQGHVLLHRGVNDAFWALPGGRLDPGEMSDEALVREMKEELGVAGLRIRRLVWVIENRFLYNGAHWYEVGFYYVADLPPAACPLREGEFRALEEHNIFRWFPLSSVVALDIKPPFLRMRLTDLPAEVEYLKVDQLAG